MEKYNEGRRCVKCGSVASTRWDKEFGLIFRVCAKCGFEWHECPLDHLDHAEEKTP